VRLDRGRLVRCIDRGELYLSGTAPIAVGPYVRVHEVDGALRCVGVVTRNEMDVAVVEGAHRLM
jgi:hypothetical protein